MLCLLYSDTTSFFAYIAYTICKIFHLLSFLIFCYTSKVFGDHHVTLIRDGMDHFPPPLIISCLSRSRHQCKSSSVFYYILRPSKRTFSYRPDIFCRMELVFLVIENFTAFLLILVRNRISIFRLFDIDAFFRCACASYSKRPLF